MQLGSWACVHAGFLLCLADPAGAGQDTCPWGLMVLGVDVDGIAAILSRILSVLGTVEAVVSEAV